MTTELIPVQGISEISRFRGSELNDESDIHNRCKIWLEAWWQININIMGCQMHEMFNFYHLKHCRLSAVMASHAFNTPCGHIITIVQSIPTLKSFRIFLALFRLFLTVAAPLIEVSGRSTELSDPSLLSSYNFIKTQSLQEGYHGT